MEYNTVTHPKLCFDVGILCACDACQGGTTDCSGISTGIHESCQANGLNRHSVRIIHTKRVSIGIRNRDLKLLKTGQRTLKLQDLLIPWLVVKLLRTIDNSKINLRAIVLGQNGKALPSRFRRSLLIAALVVHKHQEIGIRCKGVLRTCFDGSGVATEISLNDLVGRKRHKGGLRKYGSDQTNAHHIRGCQWAAKSSCIVLDIQAYVKCDEVPFGKTGILGRQIDLFAGRCQLRESTLVRSSRLRFKQGVRRGRQCK